MIHRIDNFRFWCQKVLPTVYDDSLSYYELLCKVVAKLNETIDESNNLYDAFLLLKEYVENYFESHDVEQLINDKLDEMVEDGTLANLINDELLGALTDRVTALEEADVLIDGRLDAVEDACESLDGRVDTLEDCCESVDGRLDALEEAIGGVTALNSLPWYSDATSAASCDASVGDTIMIGSELYVVSATDNGYGVPVENGYAIPLHLCKPINGAEVKMQTFDLATIANASAPCEIQGCCWNETIGCYAVLVQTNSVQNYYLIEIREDGTVINRLSISNKGNDIAWNPVRNTYMQVTMNAGAINIVEIERNNGTIVSSHQVLESPYYPSAIGYDSVHNRILCFSGNYYVGDVSSPVLLILDNDYNELARYYHRNDYGVLRPNTNPYTATQGGTCFKSSFVLSASVFFNDGYNKCGWRLTQMDANDGKIISFTQGLYPNEAGVAWECEGVATKGEDLVMIGYYNTGSTSSTLIVTTIDSRGHGSF